MNWISGTSALPLPLASFLRTGRSKAWSFRLPFVDKNCSRAKRPTCHDHCENFAPTRTEVASFLLRARLLYATEQLRSHDLLSTRPCSPPPFSILGNGTEAGWKTTIFSILARKEKFPWIPRAPCRYVSQSSCHHCVKTLDTGTGTVASSAHPDFFSCFGKFSA